MTNKLLSLKILPLALSFIIFIFCSDIYFDLSTIIGGLLLCFYIYEFFTLSVSNYIKEKFEQTNNHVDDYFDNQCIFGLSNTVILFIATYLISFNSNVEKIFLSLIVVTIYLILDRLTRSYMCYQAKVPHCYPSSLIGKVFCYYKKDEVKDDANEVGDGKPFEALIYSIQTILLIIAFGLIYIVIFDKSISKEILQSTGIVTLALGFLFKSQIASMMMGVKLVFRDGFKVGDWIEIPELGIDGNITKINSFSVEILHGDKTKTNIPLENFFNKSYKNWENVKEYGRRIKRSIMIDQNSIKKLTRDDIENYKKIEIIRDYLETKESEIKEYNSKHKVQRYLTNIGLFRVFVRSYLENLRCDITTDSCEYITINSNLTILVRQLSPNEFGLPLEIYTFTSTTDWVDYENEQADIFDYLLSSLKTFDLEVAQIE